MIIILCIRHVGARALSSKTMATRAGQKNVFHFWAAAKSSLLLLLLLARDHAHTAHCYAYLVCIRENPSQLIRLPAQLAARAE